MRQVREREVRGMQLGANHSEPLSLYFHSLDASLGRLLFLELRGCFIHGALHRPPCRIHPGLHVLPRRFTSRAYFLQFLVRGVAVGAHCLELLLVFGTRVGTHLVASRSQLIDLSIPLLDLRFHRREVFVLLAHDEAPLLVRPKRGGTAATEKGSFNAVSIMASEDLPSMRRQPIRGSRKSPANMPRVSGTDSKAGLLPY